ncbi:PREDICTED: elongator complex protein 6 [Nanorana parkeri]|uniref:elongator complex protein 6 n=1 Tax=Nanorana parkeri TaxID=125878 RepID=UPI0008543B9B|nr:PREDICTED: elongator complex protein 6 [Nanorana parkeri]
MASYAGRLSLAVLKKNAPLFGSLTRQFTLISDWKTDGGFLLHHFLSYYLKCILMVGVSSGGRKVCFVALAQSFSHYNLIAQKLGVNLLSARDGGQLVFLEGLRSYSDLLFSETPESDSHNPLRFLRTGADLRPLYDFVSAALAPSAGEEWAGPALLVDDLGMLMSLGVSPLRILDFLHYCRAGVCRDLQGDVVCLVHREEEDEDGEVLLRSLCHQSGRVLEAEGLTTGFCKDVHGQLKITHKHPRDRSVVLQYKIQDKNVSFFAPGLSSAVL